jgi:uncharacterized membrane protein YhaH (DUF805 family)
MVSFPDAVKMFFARYVDFQGRSMRSEYWWVYLFNLIIAIVWAVLFFGLGGINMRTEEVSPIGFILIALIAIYGLAIMSFPASHSSCAACMTSTRPAGSISALWWPA